MAEAKSPETVEAFNARLVKAGVQISLRPYIKALNVAVFHQPIDGFADDLLDLVQRDECCIPHDCLMQYGVLAPSQSSFHVSRLLDQYGFVEGQDFRPTSLKSQDARFTRKVYLFHPDAFEMCLIRAKHTRRYAMFYGQLRKSITAYDRYQLALKEHYVITLTARNTELTVEAADLRVLIAQMRAEANARGAKTDQKIGGLVMKVDEIKAQSDEMRSQNAQLIQRVDKVTGISRQMAKKVTEVANSMATAAEDRAPLPDDERKSECLVLLKLNGGGLFDYAVLRRQAFALAQGLKPIRRKFPRAVELLKLTCVPNAKSLWVRIKDRLGNGIRKKTGMIFALNGLAEQELVSSFREVYDERKVEYTGVANLARAWAARKENDIITATVTTMVEYRLTDAEVDSLLG